MAFEFPEFTFGAPDASGEEEQPQAVKSHHRFGHRPIARKLASEAALENEISWHFQEGDCWHVFSFGDVDSLTYVKHIIRQQPILYIALSTWCMAGEDVDDLWDWHRRGMLGRVDFFLGEIFPQSYADVYAHILQFADSCGGRVCVSRNHAKVMAIVGERFDVLIESSANVNTNPRCENTVLTVDRSLVADYVDLFNGMRGFLKATAAPPYQIPER